MRIAVFHELPFGGAKRTVVEHIKSLGENNLVDLYYVDEVEDQQVTKGARNTCFYLFEAKKWGGKNWENKLYKDTVELAKLYFLHKHIAKKLNKSSYDFIYVHPSRFTQAPFILRFLKHPSVYFCQEPLRMVYENLFKVPKNIPLPKRIYETINRFIRKKIDNGNIFNADLVLANSYYSKKCIKRAYGIDAAVCYLGVDSDKFKSKNIKKKYDLLFFGNKNTVRGYDLLERTLKKFRQKPIVKMISGISSDDLAMEYNKSKIVLALSRNEPFGLTVLEAMACGLPVVAVSEGGFRESVIDGKTGFLIERDPKKLFHAVSALLHDNNLRARMGKEGRKQIMTRWTWEQSVNKLITLVNKYLF